MPTASKTSHADTPPQSPEVKAKDPAKLQAALKVIINLLVKGTSLNKFSLSPPLHPLQTLQRSL